MPRWGQASRSANGEPSLSRPMTNGISNSVAWWSWLRLTWSAGRARYQNPNSINESGVCWRGASRSGIGGTVTQAGDQIPWLLQRATYWSSTSRVLTAEWQEILRALD